MTTFGAGSFGSTTRVVRNLLIINIAIYCLSILLWVMFGLDLQHIFGLYYFKSPDFKPYQIITHMFLHAYMNPVTNRIIIFHILFNMFGLWMFGRVLENVLGSKRFFILYFVSGIGAALIHLLVLHLQLSPLLKLADTFYNTPTYETFSLIINRYVNNPSQEIFNFMSDWIKDRDNANYIRVATDAVHKIVEARIGSITVGASGAVFGILAAFTLLFPNVELMLIFFPVPIKAKYLVPGYAVLELIFGVANFKGDNIAHFAHLGGALFGLMMVLIWKRKQFIRY